MTAQATLNEALSFIGIGLHTGESVQMRVQPAPPNTGVVFLRSDFGPAQGLIHAHWSSVVDTRLCTVLGNESGATVSTVEHLLAALRLAGIDNALVEVEGPEVPIMDGSAEPFVTPFLRVGRRKQPARREVITIQTPVSIADEDRRAILIPSPRPRITAVICFCDSAVGVQRCTVDLDDPDLATVLAGARTFGFARELELLRRRGLGRGASVRNAVVVDDGNILNEGGLRYRDEFVRHKLLDCLGDLSLLGASIVGHLYIYKPGHGLNNRLIEALMRSIGVDVDCAREANRQALNSLSHLDNLRKGA